MHKVIDVIINNNLNQRDILSKIDDLFATKKINRDIRLEKQDDGNYLMTINWEENGQKLIYQNII